MGSWVQIAYRWVGVLGQTLPDFFGASWRSDSGVCIENRCSCALAGDRDGSGEETQPHPALTGPQNFLVSCQQSIGMSGRWSQARQVRNLSARTEMVRRSRASQQRSVQCCLTTAEPDLPFAWVSIEHPDPDRPITIFAKSSLDLGSSGTSPEGLTFGQERMDPRRLQIREAGRLCWDGCAYSAQNTTTNNKAPECETCLISGGARLGGDGWQPVYVIAGLPPIFLTMSCSDLEVKITSVISLM